jgi:hypothetical protein
MTDVAFKAFKCGGVQFLAFPNGQGSVYVLDDEGRGYGAWQDLANFLVDLKN